MMLMHAGENPVEEDLARALDQALVNREDTNVFEVVRKQFIKRSLPVDGQFFEGVAMYVVQKY